MPQVWHSKSNCVHDEATKVIKLKKGWYLWAGSSAQLLAAAPWDLIISAVGYKTFLENPLSANAEAKALLPASLFAFSPPACIGIDWPDRGIPTLSKGWWQELATVLRGFEGRVGICCMGGHGRTGTAVAILASLLGKVKGAGCPVTWVRKKYCPEAVEANCQLNYIELMTGRTVTAEASDVDKFTYAATLPPVVKPAAAVIPISPLFDKALKGATGGGANPTKTAPATLTGTTSGSVGGEPNLPAALIPGFEPTDAALERAFADGDGEFTLPIEGAGDRRWSPVWADSDDEILGWNEEVDVEVDVEIDDYGFPQGSW